MIKLTELLAASQNLWDNWRVERESRTKRRFDRLYYRVRTTFSTFLVAMLCACGPKSAENPKQPQHSKETKEKGDGEQDGAVENGTSAQPIHLEPVGIRVSSAGEATSYDARELFTAGNALFEKKKFSEAAEKYQKLLRELPDSKLAFAAGYNLGLSLERLGRYGEAASAYEKAYRSRPSSPDGRDARLRQAAVLAEAKTWLSADETLAELETRGDLSVSHKIEIAARRGYVNLAQGNYGAADQHLQEALALYRSLTTLEDPYYVAMAHYYHAHIPHRKAVKYPARAETMQQDLGVKVKLGDEAYLKYRKALVFMSPYWATASGYQMSQLYKDIWDQAMQAPAPARLNSAEAEMFRHKLRAEIRPLLEKALNGHLENIGLAEAFGTSTPWSRGSAERVKEIQLLLFAQDEIKGEDVTPDGQAAHLKRRQSR